MNKLIATVFAGVMLVAAGSATAGDRSDGPGKHGKNHQRGPEGSMMIERFQRELRQLDLSDEQKASVKVVMQDLREQTRLIGDERKDNQELLKDLIKADSWNEDAAAQVAAADGDLAAQFTLLTSRALSDIYSQLTVDQKAELAANVEDRKDRHAAKREAHAERKASVE